jgi:hypothetical protein
MRRAALQAAPARGCRADARPRARPVSLAIRDLRDKPTSRENRDRRDAVARPAAAGCDPDSCQNRSPDPAQSAPGNTRLRAGLGARLLRKALTSSTTSVVLTGASAWSPAALHVHQAHGQTQVATAASSAPSGRCRARTSLSRPAPAAPIRASPPGNCCRPRAPRRTHRAGPRPPAQRDRAPPAPIPLRRAGSRGLTADIQYARTGLAPCAGLATQGVESGRPSRTSDRHRRTNPG